MLKKTGMMMSNINVLRLADDTILHKWLIDRIACGLEFEIIASDYKLAFDHELDKIEFAAFKEKYADAITERHDEMREQVYNSGMFAKMSKLVDIMFEKLNTDEYTPREFSSIAATLRGYLDDMTKFGKERDNSNVKTQNNFLILQSLEEEDLIKIKDPEKLRYIIDGEIINEVES
jgi:hypothetical protein